MYDNDSDNDNDNELISGRILMDLSKKVSYIQIVAIGCISFLISCGGGGGGGGGGDQKTTARLVNNSSDPISFLYLYLNPRSTDYSVVELEFFEELLPGRELLLDVENEYCGREMMVSPHGSVIGGSTSEVFVIECGSTNLECQIFGGSLTNLSVDTSCGYSEVAILPTIPIADAGDDQYVNVGNTVDINGDNSADPGQDLLTFRWEINAKPVNSSAALVNELSDTTSLYLDLVGEYDLSLEVTDPDGNQDVGKVTISALPINLITLGAHKDDVARIQGTPETVSGSRWEYGTFTNITFNNDDRVIGWNNYNGNLILTIIPGNNITDSLFISLGTHKDDVARIQGTPETVSGSRWEYGTFTNITFNNDDRVIGWNNYNGTLILE